MTKRIIPIVLATILSGLSILPTARAQELPRIGLFNLRVVGLDSSLAEPGIDALATALGSLNAGEVVTAQELNALIDAEKRSDALGCNDVSCLVEIGAAAGIDRLVTGSLTRIERSLVVSLQLVDVKRAKVQHRVTLKWAGDAADFPSLLGAAAELLVLSPVARPPGTLALTGAPGGASWRVGQQNVTGSSIQLDVGVYWVRVEAMGYEPLDEQVIVRSGQTTLVEARLKPSAQGSVLGLGLQAGVLVPIGYGYSSRRPGLAVDGMYWLELDRLAIQPRFGVRADLAQDKKKDYLELAFDVGASWLILRTPVTPFLGAGIGGRWLKTRWTRTVVQGTVIVTTHETEMEAANFGVGGYGRVGVLFFRDKGVRGMVSVDYNLAYLSNHESTSAVQVFLGFMF